MVPVEWLLSWRWYMYGRTERETWLETETGSVTSTRAAECIGIAAGELPLQLESVSRLLCAAIKAAAPVD